MSYRSQPASLTPDVREAPATSRVPLTWRDLVFVGVLAAAMVALTRGLYPIVVLIGGPVLGPGIIHHSFNAIPLGALVALGYLRGRKGRERWE